MNKILVSKSGIAGVSSVDNVIMLNDGDYFLEYLDDGEYSLSFNILGNVKLIESSFDKDLVINNKYDVKNGKLMVVKFYNNKSVDETIDIDLCNEGSKIDYCFSNICRGVEKYIININHLVKNTISNINNKSVALLNSSIKFIINSNVNSNGVGSVLDQNTRVVTMGECDAEIRPNMFIDLDDVEAKHGSVIGRFKDDQIFYLMSKGISYNEALKLLIKGYLISNYDFGVDLRTKIVDIINTYWR